MEALQSSAPGEATIDLRQCFVQTESTPGLLLPLGGSCESPCATELSDELDHGFYLHLSCGSSF